MLKLIDKINTFFLIIISFLNRRRSKILNLKKINKIGVIKLSAMGDALSLLPTIREIKKIIPNSKIIWITTKRVNVNLFKNYYIFDDIIILEFSFKCFFKIATILKEKIDICIDFDQYYKLSELLSFLFSKGNSIGFKTSLKGNTFLYSINYDKKMNEKLLFSKLIEISFQKSLNIDPKLPELLYNYSPPNKVKDFINNFPQKKIFIHPGSSFNASFRRWPLEKYLKLADKINYYFEKVHIIFVGGPHDLSIKKELNKNNYIEIINEFKLIDMLYIFSKGTLFVGNDSGLLHLAETAGLTSVSIFGPNIASKWGSLLSNSKKVEIYLTCRPCIKQYLGIIPRRCKFNNIKCINSISVKMVFDKIVECLSN